jgi:ectoine hydroxylase-related dioxygenase (phytanoyl-CoA dioxygenase family)
MRPLPQRVGISSEQLREYEKDGVTCVRGVLSQMELRQVCTAIDECVKVGRGGTKATSKAQKVDGFCLWMRNERLRAIACRSHLPQLASLFLDTQRVNLLCDHLFIKEPDTPDYLTPWHNDQPYWCVSGSQVVTFWLALDSVSRGSGGLNFVRGSHRWNFETVSGDCFEPTPGIDENPDRYSFAQYDLVAGDMTVHHGLTVHGATGNATNKIRRGYVIRYTGEDVRYKPNRAFVVPGSEEIMPGQPLDSPAFPVVFSTAGID